MDWLDERLFKVVVECMRISVNHACCGWFVLEFIYLFYECGDLTFYQTATDLEWKPSQECLKTKKQLTIITIRRTRRIFRRIYLNCLNFIQNIRLTVQIKIFHPFSRRNHHEKPGEWRSLHQRLVLWEALSMSSSKDQLLSVHETHAEQSWETGRTRSGRILLHAL